jgi:Icc-related predicted phosphoesterase
MKIIATSDLHGHLPNIKEEFDLLLICGDVCPATEHSLIFQHSWCTKIFIKWLNELPYRNENSRVFMVWGNHDFIGESKLLYHMDKDIWEKTNGRVQVLNHCEERITFPDEGTIRIFGSPYCAQFFSWAFMKDNDFLEKAFSEIPESVDILITHDSPSMWLFGEIKEGMHKSKTTGNKLLGPHVLRVHPKMYFSGHFHSGEHEFAERDGIWGANVSFVNERYCPVNPLLKVEFDFKNKSVISHGYINVDCVDYKNWKL